MSKRVLALAGLIFIAAVSRVLPHPWNWTAVGAVALLGGARFEKMAEALFVPLAAMMISDALLGSHVTQGSVYGAIALTSLLSFVFRSELRGWKIGVGALLASAGFYLITNFGVWMSGGLYPATFKGLIACYVAGLPFFASQVLGDLFYASSLFWLWDRVATPALVPAKTRH